ncbi:MAG: Minf_1886 family protein [Gemmataceae bacterium]
MHHPKLEELVRRDPRYPIEAYDFVRDAILHVLRPAAGGAFSAGQLLRSIPELARREFGMLAPTVFRAWNVRRTADVGRVVANLVAAGLMTAGADEAGDDFGDADLAPALGDEYRIDWPRERLER